MTRTSCKDSENFLTRQSQPNQFGLYDKLGFLGEYCADRFHSNDPALALIAEGHNARVVRGMCQRIEPPGSFRYSSDHSFLIAVSPLCLDMRCVVPCVPALRSPSDKSPSKFAALWHHLTWFGSIFDRCRSVLTPASSPEQRQFPPTPESALQTLVEVRAAALTDFETYDVEIDPGETQNLAGRNLSEQDSLTAAIRDGSQELVNESYPPGSDNRRLPMVQLIGGTVAIC